MGLNVQQLSKQFGHTSVIEQFDLNIEPGEIVILLGESGSGKTTLLRLINGLETADEGSISINGTYLIKDGVATPKNEQQSYQLSVGMVFQDYQLFPNLTVKDNLLLAPLSHQTDTKDKLAKRAYRLLDQMGVADKMEQKPNTLSGGQKQRVAIARAMMMNPSLMCFDEPTSALDAQSVEQVATIIRSLSKEQMMILVITHDVQLVDALQQSARVIQATELKQATRTI